MLATLVDIRGGAARELGLHMAVAADGRYRGYVSGGCEAAVASEALLALSEPCRHQLLWGHPSGPTGLLQEIQARLPAISKKAVSLEGVDFVLTMSADAKAAFNAAASIVAQAMDEAPTLPVIPREI